MAPEDIRKDADLGAIIGMCDLGLFGIVQSERGKDVTGGNQDVHKISQSSRHSGGG